jgi:RimJ/RimL family protein N-acetyltransferase
MKPREHRLKNGKVLNIREVVVRDAAAVLEYVHAVSAESPYLTFGPDEFEFTEAEERAFIADSQAAQNRLFILGSVGSSIVGLLNFSGGRRPRIRHCGEFGISVRKAWWGQGVGSLMLDALIAWARETGLVTKINLRVRTDNERAISLYGRKGFVREGTVSRDMQIAGTYFDNYMMGLRL